MSLPLDVICHILSFCEPDVIEKCAQIEPLRPLLKLLDLPSWEFNHENLGPEDSQDYERLHRARYLDQSPYTHQHRAVDGTSRRDKVAQRCTYLEVPQPVTPQDRAFLDAIRFPKLQILVTADYVPKNVPKLGLFEQDSFVTGISKIQTKLCYVNYVPQANHSYEVPQCEEIYLSNSFTEDYEWQKRMIDVVDAAKIKTLGILWDARFSLNPWTRLEIEELDIGGSTQVHSRMRDIAQWFPYLKSLIVHDCNVKDEEILHFRGLEKLSIGSNHHLDGTFLQSMSHLKCLEAMEVSQLMTRRLWTFVETSHLEKLSADLTTDGLASLQKALQDNPNLTWLELNCSPLQTKPIQFAWTDLVSSMSRVRTLKLHFSQVQKISFSWKNPLVECLLSECPGLQLWIL